MQRFLIPRALQPETIAAKPKHQKYDEQYFELVEVQANGSMEPALQTETGGNVNLKVTEVS